MELKNDQNVNNNLNHNKIIACYISDNIFGGYAIYIESDKLELNSLKTLEELESKIISYCYNDLQLHLRKYKFEQLIPILQTKHFHMHTKLILPLVPNNPIYICSH